MATINLSIPDAQLPRVIAALCSSDPANLMAPTAANAKGVVIKWVTDCVKTYETRLAQQALAAVDTAGLVT